MGTGRLWVFIKNLKIRKRPKGAEVGIRPLCTNSCLDFVSHGDTVHMQSKPSVSYCLKKCKLGSPRYSFTWGRFIYSYSAEHHSSLLIPASGRQERAFKTDVEMQASFRKRRVWAGAVAQWLEMPAALPVNYNSVSSIQVRQLTAAYKFSSGI